MRKPDFIGIGAQRSGTSWLYACLFEHPEICMPKKEIHFFSRESNWRKGIEWYEKIFSICAENKICGEISTSYLASLETPKRIFERYGKEIKFFVILRNPIERTFSAYKNAIIGKEIPKNISFEDAIKEFSFLIEYSLYGKYLPAYFELFDRNFKVFFYDELRNNLEGFIKVVYRFLGVTTSFRPTFLDKKVNPSRNVRFVFIDRLIYWSSVLIKEKISQKLWWYIKKSEIPGIIRKINTIRKEESIPQEVRNSLSEIFAKDLEKLEEYVPEIKRYKEKWLSLK